MRYLTQILVLLAIITTFIHCESSSKGIIERGKFIDILIDLHISDAVLSSKGYFDGSLKDSTDSYYNYILKKYNISRADFDKSLAYYNKDTEEYLKMYNEVVEEISYRVPKTLNEKSIYMPIQQVVEDFKNLSNLEKYYGESGKSIWQVDNESELPNDTANIPYHFVEEIKYPCKIDFSCELQIDSTDICEDMNIKMEVEYKDKSLKISNIKIISNKNKWKEYKLSMETDSIKRPSSISVDIANCNAKGDKMPKLKIKKLSLKLFAPDYKVVGRK